MSVAALASLALAGCGVDEPTAAAKPKGPRTPEEAVTRYLTALGGHKRGADNGEQARRREVIAYWGKLCDTVDPKLRKLRFDEGDTSCGGIIALFALYTGDTSGVKPPAGITGKVRTAKTSGASSIVSVAITYQLDDGKTSTAGDVKMLVVRRDGAWWVASPQAVNILNTRDGGMTERELRDWHKKYTRG